jgi:formylglycine-generating enzyme required for sulfatase activity
MPEPQRGFEAPLNSPRPAVQVPRSLPERFGRYHILRRLGQGGMGSVYLAENTELGDRLEALKTPDVGDLERFRREARAAAGLRHPNICTIHDSGVVDGIPYLTMAFVEGKPLSDVLQERGFLPQHEAAALVRTLADAMSYAHGKGVVHRDLKPSNVLLERVGSRVEPVIVDFGLARRDHPDEAVLSKTGEAMGTPAYMAPEQARGDRQVIGPASDIYALGVIFYELLTGRRPFMGSFLHVLAQLLTEAPPPPSQFMDHLDPELEGICLRAIAKNAQDRYPSMGAFADALGAALATRPLGSAVPVATLEHLEQSSLATVSPLPGHAARPRQQPAWATPVRPAAKRKRAWPWLGAAAAVALCAGVLLYAVYNHGRVLIVADGPAAKVLIDGKEVPGARLKDPQSLSPGRHTLTVVWQGGGRETREFVVRRGRQRTESVIFREGAAPHAQDGGRARVVVRGPTAAVLVDGQALPPGALDAPVELAPGTHLLTVEWKDGEREIREFTVARGREVVVDVAGASHPAVPSAETGRLRLSVDGPKAALRIDGAPQRLEALDAPVELPAGAHEVTVVWADGERETRAFTVSAGRETAVAFAYTPAPVVTETGRARIVVEGPATAVFIDGRERPLAGLSEPLVLPTGAHQLSVVWKGIARENQAFTVSRGEEVAVTLAYAPKPAGTGDAPKGGAPGPAMPAGTPKVTSTVTTAALGAKTPEPPAARPEPTTLVSPYTGMKLVVIREGAFLMGSEDGDADELPVHRVTVSHEFYLGQTEVTQGQYQRVMGENPSHFRGSDDLPVEKVSWSDALRFCNILSAREGLKPYYRVEGDHAVVLNWDATGYRLPTESEWEYACRAGAQSKYPFGDDVQTLGDYAWYSANSKSRTHPVGQKQPNAFGLMDMCGNVWEWCWDEHVPYPLPARKNSSPTQPAPLRAMRGGGWQNIAHMLRSAERGSYAPGTKRDVLGFRVARLRVTRPAGPDRDR